RGASSRPRAAQAMQQATWRAGRVHVIRVTLMLDDFTNFRSAIEWPDFEAEEVPTRDFVPLHRATAKALECAAESFTMSEVTESPIETIFGAKLALALRPVCEELGWTFSVGTQGDADVRLCPQYPLQRFRYDFAILAKGQSEPLILVECDGKEFHSTAE